MNFIKVFFLPFVIILSVQNLCNGQEETLTINGPATVNVNQQAFYSPSFITNEVDMASWNPGGGTVVSQSNSSITMMWSEPGTYSLEYDLYTLSGVHYYGYTTITVVSLGPPQPETTAATNITDYSFTANWNSVSGAVSYLLDVSTNQYFESYITNYPNRSVSGTSAVVTGLAFGTTYYYRVRAVNSNGNSQYSNTMNVTTTATLPAAPLAGSATNTTSDSFIANWNGVSGAGSYRLDVSMTGDFSSFVYGYLNLTVYSTSQLVSGLAAGTTYYYQVRAVNPVGSSANSNRITAPTAVPQPLPVYVQINGAATANLYQPVSYSVSFYTSAGPVIDQPALSSASWNVGNYEVSHTNYSITMQWEQPGTYLLEYDFYDTNGEHYYAQLSVNVTSSGPPQPLAYEESDPTGTSFVANWQPAPGATSYLLDVIYPNSTFVSNGNYVTGYKNRSVTGVAESVVGLQPGSTYYYRLRAVNASGGISTASNIVTATTLGPPPTPVIGSASNIKANSFIANWQPIPGENALTVYKIDIATDINFNNLIYHDVQVTGSHYYYAANLNGNTPYFYRVRAFNSVGPSVYSNHSSVTTAPVPSAPLSLNATNVTNNSFTASWSAVAGATSYQLDVSLHEDFSDYLSGFNNLTLSGTSKTISGLAADVKYYFRVRTIDAVGTSSFISTSVTTLMAPPLVPVATDATNVNIGAGSFTANWGTVINATSYQLDVSTNRNFTSVVSGYNGLAVTGTSANVTGLTEKTVYYYRVRALNNGGGSSYSNTIMAMNTDKNYIRSVDLQVAGYSTISQVDTAKVNRRITSYTFFDGLGRPVQSVSMQGSPLKNDIVQPVVYDEFGRENIKYLPYTSVGNDGWFNENPVGTSGNYTGSVHEVFYKAAPNKTDKIPTDSKPYTETKFEPSPLNRVLKQGAPGATWQPNSSPYTAPTDYSIAFSYGTNTAADAVLNWRYVPPTGQFPLGLVKAKIDPEPTLILYAANQLYKNSTKDEHHNEVIEFKDKEGRVVVKQVQAPAGEYAQTYYVYDDFGSLVCVLPPEGVKAILQSPSNYHAKDDAEKDAFLQKWAFRYTYDNRRRMTIKQVPGAEPVYMIYDKRDRLVMTQDGNQRTGKNEWTFTKYDALNRPVLTGIADMGSKSLQTLRDEAAASTAFYESVGSIVHGYTNNSYPQVNDANAYLTVTYYDDYSFKTLLNNNEFDYTTGLITNQYKFNNTDNASFPYVKGLVTATKVKVLESAGPTFLWTVNYYDDKYRVAQVVTHNNKGGTDRISSVYDFVGKVKRTQTIHKVVIDGTTTTHKVERRLAYDHAGRLLQTFHKVDDQPEVLLTENEYNELGQVTAKKLFATADPPVWQEGTTYNAVNVEATQYNNEKYIIAGGSISLKPGFTVPAGKTFNARIENVWNAGNSHPANNKFAQVVDYRYNIRGWLTRINNSDLTKDVSTDPSDYFGLDLNYEQIASGLGNTPCYNGNISSVRWSNNLGLSIGKENAYKYYYDPMNRIISADFREKWTAWGRPKHKDSEGNIYASNAFSESNYSYDLNGNIQGLLRQGAVGIDMDSLKYYYQGNQLQKVTDKYDKTKGFIDGTNTGSDYTYDANGNMVSDQNKMLTAYDAIQYNHLNLPKRVTKGTEGYIKYIYDATGRKLRQEVYNNSNALQKSTDYAGEFIYENNVLQFANHEEGRVVMLNNGYEYQYHMKDHLGNVRMTFTTKDKTDEPVATLEDNHVADDQGNYLKYADARRIYSTIFDHTNGASPGYAQRLSGTANEKLGLARSIAVMPGDKLKMEVYAKYFNASNSDMASFVAWVASMVSGGSVANSIVDGIGYASSAGSTIPFTSPLNKSNESGSAPKAYLNWVVFDKNYNPVSSGYKRITTAALQTAGADGQHEKLESPELTITEPGFAYIWLSNENETPVEVYFDDFKVTQVKSPVVQMDDYYPFGMTFNSYQRENSLLNDYKYNGKEEQTELGLGWLDYGARMYMPEIGRWIAIDPLSNKMVRWSPYSYAFNRPLIFSDLNGEIPWPKIFGKNKTAKVGSRGFSSAPVPHPKDKGDDGKPKMKAHLATDLGAAEGDPIHSLARGEVIEVGNNSKDGNYVTIKHGKGFKTRYSHIRDDGTMVKKGDQIEDGQLIAEVGHTGSATGPHLHLTMWKDDVPIDPVSIPDLNKEIYPNEENVEESKVSPTDMKKMLYWSITGETPDSPENFNNSRTLPNQIIHKQSPGDIPPRLNLCYCYKPEKKETKLVDF